MMKLVFAMIVIMAEAMLPMGNPPIRLSAKKCKRVNFILTVTNQGIVRFMIYKDRMNVDTFIKFMKRLIKDADRKIFLIFDKLRVHHSHKARDWLEEHTDQLEVFFLPSYSSELNPDKYFNFDLKTAVHHGPPVRSKEQLKNKALSHLRELQRMPKRIMKFFKHSKIAYAA
jgi:transposase